MDFAPRSLYGILGLPLGHSLSPVLHNWGFRRVGYPGVYLAWEKTREELPAFFAAVRSLPVSGLSVTIPHKQAVRAFLDEVTPRAALVGAVNTVYWREQKLVGENTDVAGFLAPLAPFAESPPERTLILGAGGACRAVLAGLGELGFQRVTVTARSEAKARALADAFGCRTIPWERRALFAREKGTCLVINATPLGMRGAYQEESPLPAGLWDELSRNGTADAPSVAYDLVYNPRDTRFLQEARDRGMATIGGLDFFLAQGLEQFRLWTGHDLPVEEAAALLRTVLAQIDQASGQTAGS